MKIYTKTGDHGETSLVGGTRISKTDRRLAAYGTVDELNAITGFVLAELEPIGKSELAVLESELVEIQHLLFIIGSQLASEDQIHLSSLPLVQPRHISKLEASIDKMSALLPELNEFILPGGSHPASLIHLARTVCRRAEREVLYLPSSHQPPAETLILLNRLSDFFFVAARFCNWVLNIKERTWKKDV